MIGVVHGKVKLCAATVAKQATVLGSIRYQTGSHHIYLALSVYVSCLNTEISLFWWESLCNVIQELHWHASHENDCSQIPGSPDASILPVAAKGCCLFQCYLGLCLTSLVICCRLDYLQYFLATHGLNMQWIMNLSLHVRLVLSRIIQN